MTKKGCRFGFFFCFVFFFFCFFFFFLFFFFFFVFIFFFKHLTSHIGPIDTRSRQEALLALTALVAHRPALVKTHLKTVVGAFQHQLSVSEEDVNLMNPHFFGHVFASQMSLVSPQEVVDLLWSAVSKPGLFCGMLEGSAVSDDVLERLLDHVLSSSRNEIEVAALLRRLAASSTPSSNRLALARRFRASPLLFPRSPAISTGALSLAVASVHTNETEAKVELAFCEQVLHQALDSENATSAMAEFAVAAIEGCRLLGIQLQKMPQGLFLAFFCCSSESFCSASFYSSSHNSVSCSV